MGVPGKIQGDVESEGRKGLKPEVALSWNYLTYTGRQGFNKNHYLLVRHSHPYKFINSLQLENSFGIPVEYFFQRIIS